MIVDRRALQTKERIEASMVRKKMCNSPPPHKRFLLRNGEPASESSMSFTKFTSVKR